jgi:D-inositol-3-phosphate glycosyltransferase
MNPDQPGDRSYDRSYDRIRPLRIAMFSIHSSPIGPLGSQNTGGMSVYIRELAKIFGEYGHHVDIFTYGRGPAPQVMLYPNVRLVHLAQDRSFRIKKEDLSACLPEVYDALERFRNSEHISYDLIHSHYWLSGVVGAMAQTRWRCPHVTMFHTLGIVKNRTASGEHESDRRIAHERWLAKMADHIIVPSARERENLLHYYHAQPERISVIPCGVNLELFKPLDRGRARMQLGLDPRADIILYVGRFAPLKGLDRLLQALVRLKAQFARSHLVFVGGDGPHAESSRALSRLTAACGMQSHVTFAGRVEQHNLPPYYSAADLLVLPSHYESFGLVILESLACGTPVAVTPVGAVEAILSGGRNGVLIESAAVDDVARGIANLLEQPAATKPSAEQIRATVTEFSWPTIALAVAGIYERVLQARNRDLLLTQSACRPLPG